jgi:hypothetical protein
MIPVFRLGLTHGGTHPTYQGAIVLAGFFAIPCGCCDFATIVRALMVRHVDV